MTYIKLVVLLLQVTQAIIRMMDERRLIAEGERRVIAAQLAKLAKIAKVAEQVRQDVGTKSDAEIDDALRGDYRD